MDPYGSIKGGFHRKILRIDLTERKSIIEEIPDNVLKDFLGGRGLGAKILYDEVPDGVDPLSNQNKIIFSPGPITGTAFPTSARTVVVTKSPMTGGYMDSMAGGKFGLNIKKAGFDSIIIEGRSEKPVYVSIKDDAVEFRDASYLRGMKTTFALYFLKDTLGNNAAIVINGPAGENLVRMAGLMTDDFRQFGRGGAGAVLGSKNVKAIAVAGTRKTGVYDREGFRDGLKDIRGLLKKQPGVSPNFTRYGSGEDLESMRSVHGILPTRNWTRCTFDNASDISMVTMRDQKKMVARDQGCIGCTLRCGKLTKAVSKEFAGYFCDGPEYETLYSFGSNCMIGDPNFVVAANMVCDELGLDTLSAGLTISFAMECMEKGLLTPEDLDGKELNFGSTRNILETLEDMAFMRGGGEILAHGTKNASEKLGGGADKFAMHVKGLELGGYDPRSAKGQAIVFAAGNRGGCHHNIGLAAVFEVNQGICQEIEGKGMLVRRNARIRILSDCFVNCTFAFSRSFDYGIWSRILHAVTGIQAGPDRLEDVADRINTIERLYNLRDGFTVKDDTLPRRLMEDPLPDGPYRGEVVTQVQLVKMRTDYFTAMGWDEGGVPTKATLDRLGL